ncbi:MAG TPA: hypothetical protein VHF89_04610 [Solirubrobacteraceae bacterium]|nr:hypothetical protein [Solirubrobacteraceae bacterium]
MRWPLTSLTSVGFQNEGNAMDLYVTQMFIDQNGAYIQVVNNSATDIGWWLWVVQATLVSEDEAAVPEPEVVELARERPERAHGGP